MVRHTADRWLEMARAAKAQMDAGKDVHQRVVDLVVRSVNPLTN